MWIQAIKFGIWLLGLFGIGNKDERDVAHDQGRAQGIAEQKASDQAKTIEGLSDVVKAQKRMEDVPAVGDDTAIDRLRDGTA